MKETKNMMAALFDMMSKAFSNKENSKVIIAEQLPTSVKNFVMFNFPNQNIASIEMKQDANDTVYEICFSEGTEVRIDSNGNWETVDGKLDGVPASILPQSIKSFLKNHLANMRVLRIDKTDQGYHTFLSDASMVDFNYNGVAA